MPCGFGVLFLLHDGNSFPEIANPAGPPPQGEIVPKKIAQKGRELLRPQLPVRGFAFFALHKLPLSDG